MFFDFFSTFFASKSHFFERRTSSHVGWRVIVRRRLRAPCLQVLSSYFRTGPFGKMCPSVCVSGDFVILPKGIWRCDRVQFSLVLWPEKCLPYFSGPESSHQLRTFSPGIGPKRDPKTGPSFFNFFELFLLQNLTSLDAARHLT